MELTLKDLKWSHVLIGNGARIYPGWNGSPALLSIDDAVKEFWLDKKQWDHFAQYGMEGDYKPTVIKLAIKEKGKRRNPKAPYDYVSIATSDDVAPCPSPRCRFPRLKNDEKCLACGSRSSDDKPISFADILGDLCKL